MVSESWDSTWVFAPYVDFDLGIAEWDAFNKWRGREKETRQEAFEKLVQSTVGRIVNGSEIVRYYKQRAPESVTLEPYQDRSAKFKKIVFSNTMDNPGTESIRGEHVVFLIDLDPDEYPTGLREFKVWLDKFNKNNKTEVGIHINPKPTSTNTFTNRGSFFDLMENEENPLSKDSLIWAVTEVILKEKPDREDARGVLSRTCVHSIFTRDNVHGFQTTESQGYHSMFGKQHFEMHKNTSDEELILAGLRHLVMQYFSTKECLIQTAGLGFKAYNGSMNTITSLLYETIAISSLPDLSKVTIFAADEKYNEHNGDSPKSWNGAEQSRTLWHLLFLIPEDSTIARGFIFSYWKYITSPSDATWQLFSSNHEKFVNTVVDDGEKLCKLDASEGSLRDKIRRLRSLIPSESESGRWNLEKLEGLGRLTDLVETCSSQVSESDFPDFRAIFVNLEFQERLSREIHSLFSGPTDDDWNLLNIFQIRGDV